MSALGRLLKLVAHLFHLLLIIIMKSILLWVLRSGDSHIHSLLVLFGLNMVFVMHRLFVAQKVSSFSPQGFTFPNPNFPMTFSHWVSSSPTFAFKSPITIKMSLFGVLSISCWSRSKNSSTLSPASAVFGAWTWITVMAPVFVWNFADINLGDTGLYPRSVLWACLLSIMATLAQWTVSFPAQRILYPSVLNSPESVQWVSAIPRISQSNFFIWFSRISRFPSW